LSAEGKTSVIRKLKKEQRKRALTEGASLEPPKRRRKIKEKK